jgi:probable rRNA maturation factor
MTPKPAKLDVTVAWNVRPLPGCAAELRRVAAFVAKAEKFRTGVLSIAVVGDRRMSRLHAEYSGIPGPTDVLTFDLGTDRRRARLDGEIVVCHAVALRRAGPRRVLRELSLYVAHGVLHLAGYDDHTPRDFARMHAREDELLAKLGLGRVFSDD